MANPVSVTLEIHADRTRQYNFLFSGGTIKINLKNASEYGIQLKYSSGSLALGPGAVSETYIFHYGQGMAKNWLGSLELKRVTDVSGNNIPLYNLKKVVVQNKKHCILCCIPLW
jgi:hypothetical protein